MKEKIFLPHTPEGMFTVRVERSVKHDSREKMHYEYSYTVDLKPCACDFVSAFANLVRTMGKRQAVVYAECFGVSERQLKATLETLTGAGPREWADTFACAVSEALLRETNWEAGRIGQAVGIGSVTVFSRFFRRIYGCSPLEWRWRNQ